MSNPPPERPQAVQRQATSLPDLAVALGVVLLGLLLLAGTRQIQSTMMYKVVGPQAFPTIVSVGLLLLGALLTISVLRGDKAEPATEEDTDPDAPVNHLNPVIIVGGFLLGALLLGPLGFVIGTSVMYVSVAYAFGERRWGWMLLVAVLLAVVSFEVFTRGLGLTLPPGLLKGVL